MANGFAGFGSRAEVNDDPCFEEGSGVDATGVTGSTKIGAAR